MWPFKKKTIEPKWDFPEEVAGAKDCNEIWLRHYNGMIHPEVFMLLFKGHISFLEPLHKEGWRRYKLVE